MRLRGETDGHLYVMKHLKLMFVFFSLFIATTAISSCDKDDEPDKSNNNGDGKTSGWVEIGNAKFNVKYGYFIDYGFDEGCDEFSFVLSDNDLSDIYKHKLVRKTISMIEFWFQNDIYHAEEVDGGYKITYDPSKYEDVQAIEKDSFFFNYYTDYPDNNPEGGYFKHDKSDKAYTFEGEGLKAYANTYDTDDEEIDLDMKSFSFSIQTMPQDITDIISDWKTRGVEITVITDPQEKKLFRKYFGRK